MKEHQAWRRQRELKKQAIPEQEYIYNLALKLSKPLDRALFVIAYLTGGRISEIIKKDFLIKSTYEREKIFDKNKGIYILRLKRNENGNPITSKREKMYIHYEGIRPMDITFKEELGKPIMVISMDNRKNKNFTRKNLPIPINREGKLIDLIEDYISHKESYLPLFPISISKAEKIIAKVDMNPHFLRDIRLTHLVTIYGFDAFQLTKFAGWKNVLPAERYIRLGTKDLVKNY